MTLNPTRSFLYTHLEEFMGASSGSITGVIIHKNAGEILLTLAVAVCTGFLGAFGAHLFKLIRNKLNKPHEP